MRSIVLLLLGFIYTQELTASCVKNLGQLLDVGKGFDLNTREPTYNEHNVSPFRQLIIRLIQGRQAALADYQQHGLHNFLTRSEDASAWSSNIDGVIGAVNRESFQWP